jgi:hypothetical protein
MKIVRYLGYGAAAGAAGTTALNAVTYLDMVLRARPASSTPQESVERLADDLNLSIPGDGEERDNRIAGLGPMLGILTGVGTGMLLGGVRALRPHSGFLTATLAATTVAMAGSNAPMAALGISDPRSWSASDWISDAVPHLAFGLVTGAALHRLATRD